MSAFSGEISGEFLNAARAGNLPLVKSLSIDPRVDLNWQDEDGWTPFYWACCLGHVDSVRYLLDFHDNRRGPIDYNLARRDGTTPFSIACACGHAEVMEMLLEDERIDVNKADEYNQTPLWDASYDGHVDVVRWLLASTRRIDVAKPDLKGKTAAEIAREQGAEDKQPWESGEEFQRRIRRFSDTVALVEAYQMEPEGVRERIRRELGIDVRLAGELFALVVYLSDGYLALPPEKQGQKAQRFFSIATQLPMDLQMVLCNRVFAIRHSIVKSNHSERGFKKFAKGF